MKKLLSVLFLFVCVAVNAQRSNYDTVNNALLVGAATNTPNATLLVNSVNTGAALAVVGGNQSGITLTGTILSSGSNAYGFNVAPTLRAAANNTFLYGFYVNPTFDDNGKTSISHIGFDIAAGNVIFNGPSFQWDMNGTESRMSSYQGQTLAYQSNNATLGHHFKSYATQTDNILVEGASTTNQFRVTDNAGNNAFIVKGTGGITVNKNDIPLSTASTVQAWGIDTATGNTVRFYPPDADGNGMSAVIWQSNKVKTVTNTTSVVPISDTLGFLAPDANTKYRVTATFEEFGGFTSSTQPDILFLNIREPGISLTISGEPIRATSTDVPGSTHFQVNATITYSTQNGWEVESDGKAIGVNANNTLTTTNWWALTSMDLTQSCQMWFSFNPDVASATKGMRMISWTVEKLHI